MTAVAAPVAPVAPTSPAGSPSSRGWRPNRWTFLVAGALVLTVTLTVWNQRHHVAWSGDLDPQNPSANGAQALARVLGQQGVDVRIARSAADLDTIHPGADSTVVVTSSRDLVPSTVDRLRTAAAGALVVVVDPDQRTVRYLSPRQSAVITRVHGVAAACDASVGVPLEGLRLTVDEGIAYRGSGCFGTGRRALLVADGGLLLFGGGQALTNDQVLRADDAAVALRLLGQRPHLVWYVPTAADAQPHELASASLIPLWIEPALVLLVVALIALMLWRGRRLGPLTVEPLPAVVRAAETTYSRGRLYRRTGDRGHAAAILRRSAQRSVVRSLRLDRSLTEDSVAAAVAERLGLPPAYVVAVLTTQGRAPATDRELIGLARELDRLKREVRR